MANPGNVVKLTPAQIGRRVKAMREAGDWSFLDEPARLCREGEELPDDYRPVPPHRPAQGSVEWFNQQAARWMREPREPVISGSRGRCEENSDTHDGEDIEPVQVEGRFWACPQCGDIEPSSGSHVVHGPDGVALTSSGQIPRGESCNCGLIWSPMRRGHAHYAVRVGAKGLERIRRRVARAQQSPLDDCNKQKPSHGLEGNRKAPGDG
mgnify:FL=1